MPPPARTVDVHPHGLLLRDKDEVVPLWAGAMHYWRHAPEQWAPCRSPAHSLARGPV